MESGKPASIVIADDHPIFRDGLHRLLNAEDGFEVIGEASDVAEVLKLARELRPDIIVLDLTILHSELKALLDETRTPGTETRLVRLCEASNHLGEILQSGARGIVLKSSPARSLFTCIRAVMNGEYSIDREFAAQSPEDPPDDASADPSLVRSPRPRGPRTLPPRQAWSS